MKRLIALVISLVCLAACQKAPELTLSGLSIMEVSADGGSGSITFTTNRDWSASSSDSWIHVSPSSGAASDGQITVSIRCDANTTYNDRSGIVTVRAEDLTQTVTIKQPQNLGIVIPTQSYNLTSDAKTIEVEVQANTEYTVSISADWIKHTGTKALTSKKLTFSIDENTTYDDRSALITIKPQNSSVAEQTINIRQGAKGAIIVESMEFSINPSGGTVSVPVKTNVEFEVKPDAGWIHYNQTKALDDKNIILTIDKNDSSDPRDGKVEILQKGGDLSATIVIKQDNPILSVEKTDYYVYSKGASLNIAVASNVEFEVNTDSEWIHYMETKALDTKTVVVKIDDNYKKESKERTGKITISQIDGTLKEIVTVVQTCVAPNTKVEASDVTDSSVRMDYQLGGFVVYSEATGEKCAWNITMYISEDINDMFVKKYSDISCMSNGWANTSGMYSGHSTYRNLNPSTTYYYAIMGNAGDVRLKSEIKSFTTLDAPYLTIDQDSYEVSGDGETLNLTLTTNVDIEVTPSVDWIQYVQTEIYGEKTVIQLKIDKNETSRPREGKVNIKQKDRSLSVTVVIKQAVTYLIPKAVDLGLSVKWASFNVGASSQEEIGYRYSWGEIETKEEYLYTNYKYISGNKVNKYCTDSSWGRVDNKTLLEPEDDVAQMKLGGGWRIPTPNELDELYTNCSWTISEEKGVKGYIVTSKVNGNSIFLPIDPACYYYTSSGLGGQTTFYGLRLLDSSVSTWRCSREMGGYVRPVSE